MLSEQKNNMWPFRWYLEGFLTFDSKRTFLIPVQR